MNDYQELMRSLRGRWALILTGVLVGMSLGAVVSMIQPVTYAATARIFIATPVWNDMIGDGSAASGSDAAIASLTGGDTKTSYGNQFTQQRMPTYLALLTTPAVLGPAAAKLETTEADLGSRVTGRLVPETVMLDITVTSGSAARAADEANATAAGYIDVLKSLESPTSVTAAASPVQPVVVAGASAPGSASAPNVLVDVAVGGTLGMLAAVAIAVSSRPRPQQWRRRHSR